MLHLSADIPQVECPPFDADTVLHPDQVFVPAVPWLGHLTRELSMLSGLGGGFDVVIGLIDTPLGRLVEPLFSGFSVVDLMRKPAVHAGDGWLRGCG